MVTRQPGRQAWWRSYGRSGPAPAAGQQFYDGRPGRPSIGAYRQAAADLGEPRLLGLVRDGLPAYA